MPYQIGVCDDDPKQLEVLAEMAEAWGVQSGNRVTLRGFPSGEAFLFAYEENRAYDILLLDVEMPGISGIDLARTLRKDNPRVEIVFITSHFEFAGEGYEVDALHYLVKPLSPGKLAQVLDKAAARLAAEPPALVVSCQGETVKLPEPGIFYLESLLHETVIHTAKEEYRTKETLTALEEKLSPDFYRAHRSYLVSLKHIARITRKAVCLDNGVEIPLARGKYDDINRAFISRN